MFRLSGLIVLAPSLVLGATLYDFRLTVGQETFTYAQTDARPYWTLGTLTFNDGNLTSPQSPPGLDTVFRIPMLNREAWRVSPWAMWIEGGPMINMVPSNPQLNTLHYYRGEWAGGSAILYLRDTSAEVPQTDNPEPETWAQLLLGAGLVVLGRKRWNNGTTR